MKLIKTNVLFTFIIVIKTIESELWLLEADSLFGKSLSEDFNGK